MLIYVHWTTSDYSFGYQGLSIGGLKHYQGLMLVTTINSYIYAGSQTSSIINITRTSNVGIPIYVVGYGEYKHEMD